MKRPLGQSVNSPYHTCFLWHMALFFSWKFTLPAS